MKTKPTPLDEWVTCANDECRHTYTCDETKWIKDMERKNGSRIGVCPKCGQPEFYDSTKQQIAAEMKRRGL